MVIRDVFQFGLKSHFFKTILAYTDKTKNVSKHDKLKNVIYRKNKNFIEKGSSKICPKGSMFKELII